jgi:hypothetical protein
VADKAVFVFQLLFGVGRTCPNEQGQGERLSENSAGSFHALEEMLWLKNLL